MKPLLTLCAYALIFLPATSYGQQAAEAPSQSAQGSAVQEKERDAKETTKVLQDLACGPDEVRHSVRTVHEPQVLPAQPADKALIYVIRPTHYGMLAQTKLAVDKSWVGVNRANNYFYFTLNPGPHHFCSEMGRKTLLTVRSLSLLSVVVEAGKTYYLQQKITYGGNDLELLSEEEGKKGLEKCRLSAFAEKK